MSIDLRAGPITCENGTRAEFLAVMKDLMALQKPVDLSLATSLSRRFAALETVRVTVRTKFVGDGPHSPARVVEEGQLSHGHRLAMGRIVAWFQPTGLARTQLKSGAVEETAAGIVFIPDDKLSGHERMESADRLIEFLVGKTFLSREEASRWIAGD